MKKIILYTLSACLLFAACKNGEKENGKKTENSVASISAASKWYKRFTGTIAGMPVVVSLYCYGDKKSEEGLSTSGGNYYYKNKSEIIGLSPNARKQDSIVFSESVNTESGEGNDESVAQWIFVLKDNRITGRWVNKDNSKSFALNLKEDYSGGAYPLEIIDRDDSATLHRNKSTASITTSVGLMMPATGMNSDDARFLEQTLLHAVGGDTLGAKNLKDCLKSIGDGYTSEFKSAMTENQNSEEDFSETDNWDMTLQTTCDYNDNGMLVFEFAQYGYTGGAHGNGMNKSICIDIQDKKVWSINNILNTDTAQISKLLDQEARRYFHLSAEDTLSNTLLIDTIPLTENIIISDKGLTFFYNPYEIASFSEGEIDLFLSYDKLKDVLKPEFKQRMKL